MNYRYQPPTEPRPDDDDDSQYDEYVDDDDRDAYGYSRYGGEYDTDRTYDSDSGGTPTWLKVIIAIGAFLIVVALVLSTIGPAFLGGDPPQQQTQSQYDIVGFVSVTDPSTIVVDLNGDQVSVKLIGIESVGVGNWFDAEVVDAMHEALDGTTLTLERAGIEEDAAGNLLRYVYMANNAMLNDVLVRNGFVRAVDARRENDRYIAILRGSEELARVDKLGAWGLPQ